MQNDISLFVIVYLVSIKGFMLDKYNAISHRYCDGLVLSNLDLSELSNH